MDTFIGYLSGIVMPALLIICGSVMAIRIRLHKILSPGNFGETLKENAARGESSPVRSLCTALAGTLGVGNMAGVATAIALGGAGAVAWMWIGAIVSMSVKYSEVVLALKYRRKLRSGAFEGGSMYTISHGMKKHIGRHSAALLGAIFALLCASNAMITGNLLQARSAISAFPDAHPLLVSSFMAIAMIAVLIKEISVSKVTAYLIPALTLVYILMSMSIILRNTAYLGDIASDIIRGAFSVRSAVGGAAGIGIREAMRYGITRGMFSNEAGCGTSPSAHAAADAVSAHHQGCFGILEVIVDTLILCTMTAFVILIADRKYGVLSSADGISVTIHSYETLLGGAAGVIIAVSVILFAYATIIAQVYYGIVAIRFFTSSIGITRGFVIASAAVTLIAAYIPFDAAWMAADLLISFMTILNVVVILIMRKEVTDAAYVK